jgi:hypothetical protein
LLREAIIMYLQLSHPRAIARLAALLAVFLMAVPLAAPSAAAAPVREDGDVPDVFLARLLDEINVRRDAAGTRRLAYIPTGSAVILDDFLAEIVPSLAWPQPCVHQIINGAFSWEYILAAGFRGDPRGEVLACPGPVPYWTPDRAAAQWWESPGHFRVLYADPAASGLACSAYGMERGGGTGTRRTEPSPDAASAVLCVTFRD